MVMTKEKVLSYVYSNIRMYTHVFWCCLGVFVFFKCGFIGIFVGFYLFCNNLMKMAEKTYILTCYQNNNIFVYKGTLDADNFVVNLKNGDCLYIPEFNLTKYKNNDAVYLVAFGNRPIALFKQKEITLDKELSSFIC